MFCGHANPAIVRAVTDQVARSTQFLLPTEDSIAVAEELARRYPAQTHWQFTLSATQANTEAIRLARAVTGREVVVLFEGHYHGHFEENMVDNEERQRRTGAARALEGRHRTGADRAVQRRRLGPRRPRARRRRDRAHRARDDEPGAHAPARAGLARRPPRAHAVERRPARARRDPHARRRRGRRHRHVGARSRRRHDREGGRGRDPDGRVRRYAGPRGRARHRPQRRDRRDVVRQPPLGRRGEGRAHRGPGPRGLRARVAPRRDARGGDRPRHRRGAPPLDHDPLRSPLGTVVRTATADRARTRTGSPTWSSPV